ncbi:MAG TPA: ABC transporter permease [Candidatus Ventricola intestinavium]|nr:ABC transporter permease [Candidatus Ventricola intestinavium]
MGKNKALVVPFALWAVIFIVVPLCLIVWYGVTVEVPVAYTEITLEDGTPAYQLEDGTVTAERPWQKKAVVSFDNFRRMLEPTYLKLLVRSLRIALITTLICLLLGYPVALILSGRDFKHPALWLMLIILPMWMNFLLRTYSWMSILENSGILNSWISALREAVPAIDTWLTDRGVGKRIIFLYNENAVILGMVYNYLSFMIMPIYTVIEKTDRSLLEAAADLGASPVKSFLRVTLPYSLPGVLEGVTMVFVPAVTTFVISQLMGGGKVPLIGDIIQNQFGKSSDWHFGATLSLLVMVVVLAFMGALRHMDREDEARKEVRIL